MKCTKCTKHLKNTMGTRYLAGRFSEKYEIVYSTITKYRCHGKQSCGHVFLVQIDFPHNQELAKTETIHQDWSVWQNAMKSRPGSQPGQTTASPYTNAACRDPHAMMTTRNGRVLNLFLEKYHRAG